MGVGAVFPQLNCRPVIKRSASFRLIFLKLLVRYAIGWGYKVVGGVGDHGECLYNGVLVNAVKFVGEMVTGVLVTIVEPVLHSLDYTDSRGAFSHDITTTVGGPSREKPVRVD